ncbi:TIGR01777 family oxidoreductase [Chromohalobacter israelensis]|uniref:TIGR01777 family oxidoreductase n=1 Tax=Chromohalobacter israelensis TaxID=141390 RepID=UPI001CC8016B|nr:TIGR01777 family oxidoreductase [Chromohalobacter salexigens]MBZ5877523.1 TIGR01777 family oxidoreductase [Chromohalobacter salexigens]
MRILITGGSGFVGRPLCRRLHDAGHELLVVSRSPSRAQALLPEGTEVRDSVLAFVDSAPEAIINLAGEPIADKRWSAAQKRRLIDSRLTVTRDLVTLCERLDTPPRVMISGSAMGYYGDQGDRDVTEQTPPQEEFAHRLCAEWESAALAAEPLGVRVVLLRTGLVLDAGGGTLAKLLLPFRLGLGGRLGSGRQYMPWIHREDWVSIALFLLERDDLAGPFNASAPHPVTNADFTRALAHHLHRPAVMAVPAGVLRLALGEMSRLLLTGARMRPARLEAAGFGFQYPTLDSALKAILGR